MISLKISDYVTKIKKDDHIALVLVSFRNILEHVYIRQRLVPNFS